VRLPFELDLRRRDTAERVGVSQLQVSRILRAALDALQRQATLMQRPVPPRGAA
jgi:DNA-directed RNA polymerase specialized sigma subunit